MPAHLTGESESLYSQLPIDDDAIMRTPSVVDSTGGAISEKQARERGRMVKIADQAAQLAFENGLKVSESVTHSLLLTPIVLDGGCGARSYLRKVHDKRMPMLQDQMADLATGNGLPVSDVIANDYARLKSELPQHDVVLPTPTLGHLRNHDEPIEDYLQRRQDFIDGRTKGMPGASLGVAVRMDWGRFEPAIRRWESLTRPAPAPTLPDGKDGAHRLSSLFTEWMMGLPLGWITGHGLKRKDELKMAGNGVVPQQAELALRYLLEQ